MQTLTYTNLRTKLKHNLDEVSKNHEVKIINRKEWDDVVLISEKDYFWLIETAYLMSTKANIDHIRESIDQLKSGKIIKMVF